MTLFYLIIGWMVGIALASQVSIPWWGWLALALPTLIGIIAARPIDEQPSPWRVVFGCLLMVMLGAARYTISIPHFDETDLASYNDQGFVTVTGVIVDRPDVRDTYTLLRIQPATIEIDGTPYPVNGLLLAQTPSITTYRYGDPVQVRGQLQTPPTGDDFSYRDYLARQDVYSLMRFTTVEVTGERQGNPIRAALHDFRAYAYQTIDRLLPAPQSSLLTGILLGIESGISPDVMADFSAVGATHVIVISGSNLVILAGVIQNTLKRLLNQIWTAVVTIIAMLVYAIFVGGDAAVMRAWFMVALVIVAPLFRRKTYGPASLAFASFIMTLLDPQTLWNVSFQLSALATLGLIWYVEPLEKAFAAGLEKVLPLQTAQQIVTALSEAFVVTVAAQITTTPLIVYYFERFSPLSLPVNFLIIPAQTYLMVLGGLGVLAALVFWPLGQLLAWGSQVFLSWTIFVVRTFARLPGASLLIENVSPGVIGGIYLIMFGATLWAQTHEDQREPIMEWLKQSVDVKLAATLGMVMAALLWMGFGALPDGQLHVSYIDVGDGSATLISTPQGRHILIDGGGSGRQLATGIGDSLPFWDREINLLILTQLTDSHLSALPAVMRRYTFKTVIYNGVRPDDELTDLIWAELESSGAQIIIAQSGMQIEVGDGVRLQVLHTQSGPAPEDDPGQPVVVQLTYNNARFLLNDDLEGWPLRDIQPVTTLLVPGQGHREASSEALLEALSPQVSVISVDEGNRFGLPHPETLDWLEALDTHLYRTDQSGTITIVTDGTRLRVKVAR